MNSDISQGSVATFVRCGGIGLFNVDVIANLLTSLSVSERIMKIGEHLAKLLTKVWVPIFIGPPCIVNMDKNKIK